MGKEKYEKDYNRIFIEFRRVSCLTALLFYWNKRKEGETMAKVLEPISDAELKKITVVNLRNEYKKLANFYQRIMNNELIYCSHCGQWKSAATFYSSKASPDGIEHYACKECILNECTDYDKKTNMRTDNREKTIETFRRINWYFNENVYNEQLQKLSEQTGEKIRSTAVQQWIVICRSLNDYSQKTLPLFPLFCNGNLTFRIPAVPSITGPDSGSLSNII